MEQNEMNSQKAQELTKEELEQVDGGKVTVQDIMKSTTAILMFL
jgi:lactobin A/cerein 7B family class IIb bacteriocin